MDTEKRRLDTNKLFALTVAAVAAVFLAVMASLTLPATDDYQYRLFLRDGFDNFIRMNKVQCPLYRGFRPT